MINNVSKKLVKISEKLENKINIISSYKKLRNLAKKIREAGDKRTAIEIEFYLNDIKNELKESDPARYFIRLRINDLYAACKYLKKELLHYSEEMFPIIKELEKALKNLI